MIDSISKDIVYSLAAEIGPDAAYYRKESDRLYLSGIEIATVIGTGVFISFCMGLVEGIKKGFHKQGEILGENLVDSLVEKLRALLDEVRQIDPQHPGVVKSKLENIHAQVDSTINQPNLLASIISEAPAIHALEVKEIAFYLKESGFPEDEVEQRAELLVVRIRREIDIL
ncbi:MAG: hypothetical protein WA949_00560 [Phormidesmis sp.]